MTAKGKRSITMQKGTIIILSAAVLGLTAVVLLLLFGLQDGLPVGDRCHCSWRKVLTYGLSACIAIALQWGGFWFFFTRCREHDNDIHRGRGKEWKTQRSRMMTFIPLGIMLLTGLIVLFPVTMFTDQNRSLLWLFVTNTGTVNVPGILCTALMLLLGLIPAWAAYRTAYK